MIGLEVTVRGEELLLRLDRLPKKVHDAVELKFQGMVEALKLKVIENLTGKVLQSHSGLLASSVQAGVERIGSLLIGYVEIPESSQAAVYGKVHEYGGKDFYEIVPVNKLMLSFEDKGVMVSAAYVYHPPAKERSFLRSALAEARPLIVAELETVVQEAMGR